MRFLVYLIPILFNGCLSMGCSVTAMPREMAGTLQAVAISMTDQAQWSSIQASLNGQVINPGFEGMVGVAYFARGTLTGVAGTIGLSGQGSGSGQASPEALATIRELLDEDPTLIERLLENETMKNAIERLLRSP